MTLRVYHRPGSRSSRTLWALEEAGATYEVVTLAREQKVSAEHAARHPMGRVPVLETEDGRFVFESAAIALHIGDLFPEAGLLPPVGDPLRAEAYQWTVFAMSELEPAMFAWRRARRRQEDETEAAERFAPIQAALAGALGDGRPWLLGDAFTMPDVLIATLLQPVVRMPLGDPPPVLIDYVDRATGRAAFVRAEERAAGE
jgi:glutathione S-transferase